jgi:hypothetical protein
MIDLDVDSLFLYFCDDYIINDKIKLAQPTIGQIVDYGEASYFSMIHTLTAIPSDVKSILWDMPDGHIDCTQIEDFELFMMFSQSMTPDKTGIIFGDLDFSKLRPFRSKINDEVVLADIEAGVKIDKLIYMRMMAFLRKLHNITPKPERAKGKRAKQAMIDEDRRNREYNKDKPFKSYLLPLISAVKVRQGYTRDYVRNMGLFEFFDDLSRLQIMYNSDHLMTGIYSGNIDAKKIKKEELNWLRES